MQSIVWNVTLARCVWVNFSVWLFAGCFGFDMDRNWKANIRLVTKLPSGIFMKPETKCNQLFLSHFYKFWFFQKLGICSTLHVWASEAAHHPSNNFFWTITVVVLVTLHSCLSPPNYTPPYKATTSGEREAGIWIAFMIHIGRILDLFPWL